MSARLKWLLPVLTLFLALAILSSSSRSGGRGGPALTLELVGPAERLLSAALGAVSDLWRGYFYLVDLRRENEELKKQADEQARRLVELAENQAAVARLTSLLGLREAYPHLLMKPAHVLAWNSGPWLRSVIISIGSDDGVAPDQAALHDQGVVGRVVEVSPHYARVLLATDFSSSIDAFVQRSRAVGILSGEGGPRLKLKYVRKDEDVRPGDQVVTSGLDGFFPRGLALGMVSRVNRQNAGLFLEVEVTPRAPFDRLEEILVVVNQGPPLDWFSLAPALRPLMEDAAAEAAAEAAAAEEAR